MKASKPRKHRKIQLTEHRKKTMLLYLRRELAGEPAPTEVEIQKLHSWAFPQNAQEHLRYMEELRLVERVRVDPRFEPKKRRSIRRLTPEGRRIAGILYSRVLEAEAESRKTNHRRWRSLLSPGEFV